MTRSRLSRLFVRAAPALSLLLLAQPARADEPAPSPPSADPAPLPGTPPAADAPPLSAGTHTGAAPPGPALGAGSALAQPGESPPFGWGDFTWMNGQSRQKDFPLGTLAGVITPSIYLDVNYAFSANHPRDNTITGSASVLRHNEVGINLASIGIDWSYRHAIGRISLQYGNMLNLVQDLDGSVTRGRSLTTQNLRYIREATAGWAFDVGKGLNVEAGIFMSFIGLESYLLSENWNYQRSLVCEATPFYFQGVRAQYFPSDRVKIEPWLMNGWQTYGKWNQAPSVGIALRWVPVEALALVGNFYTGTDTKKDGDRVRFHHDHSAVVRYYNAPSSRFVSKAAFSINNHVGFESGGSGPRGPAEANMIGSSMVHRLWLGRDKYAFAIRAEVFSNQGRYLVQDPPPGLPTGQNDQPLRIYGLTGTFDILATDFLSLRTEASYRRANLGFFAGPNGTTSSDGYQRAEGDPPDTAFVPDAKKDQALFVVAINFRL